MTVYIINKSSHDFSDAERFGELVYLSDGPMNRYGTNNMHRHFAEILMGSRPGDHIIPCSLNVMNCIASALFGHLHGTINLLLFKQGYYLERNHRL